jgi:hypothetical protein
VLFLVNGGIPPGTSTLVSERFSPHVHMQTQREGQICGVSPGLVACPIEWETATTGSAHQRRGRTCGRGTRADLQCECLSRGSQAAAVVRQTIHLGFRGAVYRQKRRGIELLAPFRIITST